MPYCTSCGNPIPEGQGKSCSMCYGDPYHGRDGYYLQWIEQMEQVEQEQRAQQKKYEEQQYNQY